MKNKMFLIIIFVIFFCYCSQDIFGDLNVDSKYTKVADDYFMFVMKSDFINAALQFHYPQNYSKEQLDKDNKNVSILLAYFEKEFGEIQAYEVNTEKAQVSMVYVFGGDISYWEQHPSVGHIYYRIQFDKEGEGVIKIVFCNITNKIQIQQVGYGILKSKPNSSERFKEIIEGLDKVFKEIQ